MRVDAPSAAWQTNSTECDCFRTWESLWLQLWLFGNKVGYKTKRTTQHDQVELSLKYFDERKPIKSCLTGMVATPALRLLASFAAQRFRQSSPLSPTASISNLNLTARGTEPDSTSDGTALQQVRYFFIDLFPLHCWWKCCIWAIYQEVHIIYLDTQKIILLTVDMVYIDLTSA